MGQGDENLDQDVILKFIQVITCSTSSQSFLQIISLFNQAFLRAASPKYQLDLEIAKKSNFFKLAQNEALRALVTKISF